MKSKTIKAILSKKLKSLITSIDDGFVRDLVKQNAIITGGSIVSMLMKENVNDFDIYFRDKRTVLAVANYYLGKAKGKKFTDRSEYRVHEAPDGRVSFAINSTGKPVWNEEKSNEDISVEHMEVGDEISSKALNESEDDEKNPKYDVVYISPNAITLSNKVQLIIRFYGEAEEIHKNYDYVHCTSYWTSWNNELVLNPLALESILCKELKYVGSLYPICSIVRLRKFLARGWTINAGQIMKMCWQISKLNLEDIKVLEDQMVGVDSAYFAQLIVMLKQKDEVKVDEAVLMTLIDRIFS